MTGDETPFRLAFEASTRALDDEARLLESMRTRAGTLFAATALVTSFLGGIALTEVRAATDTEVISWHLWSFTVLALAAFVILALLTVAILLPYRLRFSVSAAQMIRILDERSLDGAPVSPIEAYRELALRQDTMYRLNARFLRVQSALFSSAILFLVVEVAAWTVVLWRAKA